jgi:hypothetical protein
VKTTLINKLNMDLTYYLSGPMTGLLRFNFDSFDKAATELRDAGFKIVSPHELEAPKDLYDLNLWNHMMNLCEAEMKRSQGIILLNGFANSRGSLRELRWNRENGNGRRVYYYHEDHLIDLNGRHVDE